MTHPPASERWSFLTAAAIAAGVLVWLGLTFIAARVSGGFAMAGLPWTCCQKDQSRLPQGLVYAAAAPLVPIPVKTISYSRPDDAYTKVKPTKKKRRGKGKRKRWRR